jgi:hypothetical protein
MSALGQKQTFGRLLDMIDSVPGKMLKLVEHDRGTSPPQIPELGSQQFRYRRRQSA